MKVSPRYLRMAARNRVAAKVYHGKLPKATDFECVDCGEPAQEYDHRDYTKPLEVDPVCRSCHVERGDGYPAIDSDKVEVDWISPNSKPEADRRFVFMLSEQHHSALTMLSISEAVRLGQDFSRSDWIRREIEKAARRKKVWK